MHFHLNPRDLGMVTEVGSPNIAEGDCSLRVGGGQLGTVSSGVSGKFHMDGSYALPELLSTPERTTSVTPKPILTVVKHFFCLAKVGIAAATPLNAAGL